MWTVNPTHPITEGVPNPIIIDAQEMYGETFDIPAPDELIFISSFTGEALLPAAARSGGATARSSSSRRVIRTTRCTTIPTYAG